MSPKKSAERATPAAKRRAWYTRLVAAEPTLKRKLGRLGEWLVSEVSKLPDHEKPAAMERLAALAKDLNERNAGNDSE